MGNNEVVTTNLSYFSYGELLSAQKLLKAMIEQGLPDDFEDKSVCIAMNRKSGNVFLTNEEYQVAMLNGDKLESFYTLSYYGKEGFLDELLEEYKEGNINVEDCEQLAYICEANDMEEAAEEIRNVLEGKLEGEEE